MDQELFGAIAQKKQYVRAADVDKALAIQKEMNLRGNHKLIGLIMLEQGMINSAQLLEILKYIEKKQTKMSRYF